MSSHDENHDDGEMNPFTKLLSLNQLDDVEALQPPTLPPPADLSASQHFQRYNLNSISCSILIRQLPFEGLSFQLWPAASTLVTLLDSHRRDPTKSVLSAALCTFNGHRLRILELGSGTGYAGIAAATVLSADVTVTDLFHVTENLKFNVEANIEVLAANCGTVDVAELNWGDVDHMEAIGREYDVILGSDVVYYDHLYEPLIETLKYFVLGEGREGRKPVFVMAHLKRWKKESAFFKKAKKSFDVDVLHKDLPQDGKRLGVIVYRFSDKHSLLK